MLSFLRARVPRTHTATINPLTFEEGASQAVFQPAGEAHLVTFTLPAGNVRPFDGQRTITAPPLHMHLHQTEDFDIVSGAGRFIVDGAEHVVTPGGHAHVPVGAVHRFENASATEPLIVSVRLDEQNWRVETAFFRNFMGYLEDCRHAGASPSLFQLCLFLYAFDCPLALPVPGPAAVGRGVSQFFMLFMGLVVGKWLLGYSSSYPEYFCEDETDSK